MHLHINDCVGCFCQHGAYANVSWDFVFVGLEREEFSFPVPVSAQASSLPVAALWHSWTSVQHEAHPSQCTHWSSAQLRAQARCGFSPSSCAQFSAGVSVGHGLASLRLLAAPSPPGMGATA